MNHISFFVVVISFFLIIPSVSAYDGIFKILDEPYISTVSELNPSTQLSPAQDWQSGSEIDAWIDIVGWEGMTKRDDQYYILRDNERPVIRYGIKETGNVESVDNKISWKEQGNLTIARLDSVVTWYTTFCSKDSCYRIYHTSNEAFEDSEVTPLKIHASNQSIEVVVRQLNYSIINSSDIEIKANDSVYDRYLIANANGSFEKINRIWHVEKTKKGINYANESKIDIFRADNISHSQNIISIDDLNFTVSASGFYFSTDTTNITTIKTVSDPVGQFTDLSLLGFLGIFSAFYLFVFYIIMRLKR